MTDPRLFRFSHTASPVDVVSGPTTDQPAQLCASAEPDGKPVVIVHRCAEPGCATCAADLDTVTAYAMSSLMAYGLWPTTRDADGAPVDGDDPLSVDAEDAMRPLLMWAKYSEPTGPVSLAEQYVPRQLVTA